MVKTMRKLGLVATVPLFTVWVIERPTISLPVVESVVVVVVDVVSVVVVVVVASVGSVVVGSTPVVVVVEVESSEVPEFEVVGGLVVVGPVVGGSVVDGEPVVGPVEPSEALAETEVMAVESLHAPSASAVNTPSNARHRILVNPIQAPQSRIDGGDTISSRSGRPGPHSQQRG